MRTSPSEEMNRPVFEVADNRVRRSCYGHLQHAWKFRAFFFYWTRRNLVTRYRQTSLGLLWALLQPLLSSAIYAIVFSFVLRIQTPVPYAAFIITNMVLWSYFSRVVITGSSIVVGHMDLISRVQFPREYLPLAVWVESLVDLAIGLGIVALTYLYYGIPLTKYSLIAVYVFIIQTVFALALAFLLASLSVLIRDLLQAVPLLFQLLLYLSPVIYPLEVVPEALRSLYLVNPVGPIFAAYQETLLYGRFTLMSEVSAVGVFSLLLLILTYRLFKRMEWRFADVL